MSPALRAKIERLAEERGRLLESLRENPSGLEWCDRHTDLIDSVVQALYNELVEEHPEAPPFALIGTGGYGRREMAPFSDIDITVVPSDEASSELDACIRVLFQDLHWAFCTALRLDVGYAYRLIADAPGLDAATRSGLLDMRLVSGSHDLFRRLERALRESMPAGEFALAKIKEREEQYRKHHETPLVVEPQLKEGAGGLRCFQAANWIRDAIGERRVPPTEAYDHVNMVRNLLHLAAGKPQNLLSRVRQDELCARHGFEFGDFMSKLASQALLLQREYLEANEHIHTARFMLAPGVQAYSGEARFSGEIDGGKAAVGIALATQLHLRVAEIPAPTPASVDGAAALYSLTTGEATIRNLDRCGLLHQILPELTATRTVMPDDTVHRYSVFEHTLRVVRFLENVPENTFLAELIESVHDRGALYLAALLHDSSKPREDHSILGSEILEKVARRWELTDQIRELGVWLVREHLTMARFIRIRDIMNPQTVTDFAQIVRDVPRLDMLTLLTWADVNAVSSSAWTAAQETFLRALYRRTHSLLSGEEEPTFDPSVYRRRLRKQLHPEAADESEVQQFIESLPAYYLISTPADVIRLHLALAEKAARGEPTVEVFHRADVNATELTVCCLDAPGLLSRVLGVLYAYDISVAGIRACTTMSDPPVVVDVFTASFGGRPIPSATCRSISASILEVISGAREIGELLRFKGKDPARVQAVLTAEFVEGDENSPGILEIRAPRGRGLPYRLARLIAEQGWNIVSARVGQWAGNAAAAFYLLGRQGTSLTKEEVESTFLRPE
ncbi:MAG: HD domain-containing protein [Fimbriimonas sp.]